MQPNEEHNDFIREESGSKSVSSFENFSEGLNKEVLEWSKYYSEAFPRISQMVDRIIQRLPRFRAILRDRKRLNAFLRRIQLSIEKAVTLEAKRRAVYLGEKQIKDIRSAIAHCYTALVAFDDALERTMKLLELLPEDTVDVSVSESKVENVEVSTRQIPEDELIREIQSKVPGLIPQGEIFRQMYEGGKEETQAEQDEDYAEKLRFGELLIREKVITREQLQKALLCQRQMGRRQREPLGSILIRLGYTDDVSIARALAKQSGCAFISDLTHYPIQSSAVRLVPERLARIHECMPLEVRGNTLKIAIANPYNLLALEDLRLVTNCSLEVTVAPKGQIMSMIRRWYKSAF